MCYMARMMCFVGTPRLLRSATTLPAQPVALLLCLATMTTVNVCDGLANALFWTQLMQQQASVLAHAIQNAGKYA